VSMGNLPWDPLGEASWTGVSDQCTNTRPWPRPNLIKDEKVLAIPLVEEPVRFIEFE